MMCTMLSKMISPAVLSRGPRQLYLAYQRGVQGLTFLLGVALAITYIVGKRSLTLVIISHALIDMVIEPWLFISFSQ